MTETSAPLPTFVIIGAQKSGTRWLRYNLGRHPDVYTADVEPNFFIDDRADDPTGAEWYRSHFATWSGEPIVGEATPAYMIWHHDPDRSAARMQRWIPDARVVAILRDPVDRFRSAVIHHIKKGRLDPGVDPLTLALPKPPPGDRLSLVTGGWYAASLRPYVDRFGDQLLVVLTDDARDDPAGLYRRVLAHIGAPAADGPPDLDAVRFSNEPTAGVEPFDPATRARLYELYAAEIDALERLIGRDLSAWRPAVS
jgi:hypothetical protein